MVTNIPQNFFFNIPQIKEMHKGLKSQSWVNNTFYFWVIYPFNIVIVAYKKARHHAILWMQPLTMGLHAYCIYKLAQALIFYCLNKQAKFWIWAAAVVSSKIKIKPFLMTITMNKSECALPNKYFDRAVNERMELYAKLITSLWVQL